MDMNTYQQLAARTFVGSHREARSILGYYEELMEYSSADPDDLAAIVGELGDRLWYLAAICTVHAIELQEVIATPPSRSGHPGTIAAVRKKYLRGDYGYCEYRERLTVALSGAMTDLYVDCWYHNVTVQDVARANLKKIKDRARRGTIRGDGDNR